MFKRIKFILLLAGFTGSTSALAGSQDDITPNPRPSVFNSSPYAELGVSYEGLTNGYAPWQGQYLNVTVPMREDGLVYLQLLNAQRFSEQDTSAYINYAYPLSMGTINIEGSVDPNAKFLPKNLAGLGWTGKLPESFNYLLSTRATNYQGDRTNSYNYGIEKYVGQFRLAYTLISSSLNSNPNVYANKFQAQWFSDADDRLGISYTSGHEPLVITPGNITNVPTSQLQFDGLYWLTKGFGVTFAAWHATEGAYYQRNGGQLGLRVSF